jgi:Protein of unknown function (DUF1553)/Protein of unknown function (DUF1549)/Planctomycete cytochrome C
MWILIQRQWALGAGAFVLACLAFVLGLERSSGAFANDETSRGAGAEMRTVSFLREVRPILAQHCFGCHGPDEAMRKGKLRLDLKDDAFAGREGKHVIAPGDLEGSLAWERITTDDDDDRMPPEGKGEPLTEKHIATLKSWIQQGAHWEEHWSLLPPKKPALPKVSDPAWVRDPLDTFVLARLDREHMKPEAEATREAWLRRASFDLTGLPPTPAEIDDFLRDKRNDAYETQADRLLKSQRYGERQAQEWLDLARYADTSGYQIDMPREIWKWREWVINAFNANMPYDQFTIEQLAGDLLPNATLAQKVATGFNRNHPTNSEAGEEDDEYRSAYVVDRVNTTATVFMGVTLACAQCHDHKYDPLSQRDYYSFYSFFNNIKERDSDYSNPRPSIPVPNLDQEPRLADLKGRIDALKQRLERDDSLSDAAQKEWERKTLARLGKPIEWTTAPLAGMLSRGGSQLKLLEDGSILSTGPAPVKDTYDIMLLPGKKRITAIRLEVLPDESTPEKGSGRASDGRFVLSTIEIRNTTFSESQDPPLVYVSRAEADINQKLPEEPAPNAMIPGPIESAIVIEPVGALGGRSYGGWSIVDDERKKSHEAIFLPLEPLDTNEASVLRISMHHTSDFKFKSLIGRFRISYTQDDRIRELMLPAQSKLWSSIGPFPAQDVTKAYTTAFEPEKDIKNEPLDLKKSYSKVVLPPASKDGAEKPTPAAPPTKPAGDTTAPKKEGPAPDKAATREPGGKVGAAPAAAPSDGKPAAKKDAGEAGKKPAGTGVGEASKPGQTVKPGPDGGKESKGNAVEAAEKPGSEATKESKGETKSEAPTAESKEGPKANAAKPKPEKITWAEQPKWRDGTAASLQGANAAYYLARKIVSTRPRTAIVQLGGPAGFRMWVNGELAQTSLPPPPAAPPKGADAKATDAANGPDAKKDEKADDDKNEPVVPEINDSDFDASMGRGRHNPEKKFRIGLRQGENEIVVKAVFGAGASPNGRRASSAGGPMGGGENGGGSFTFSITPDGDDVLTHEVATALRLEALKPPAGAHPSAIASSVSTRDAPSSKAASDTASGPKDGAAVDHAPTTRDTSSSAGHDTTTAAKEGAPMKVSLVGEKSAPLKPSEEENKLSPTERRQKVLREFYRSHIDPIGRIIAEELSKLKDEERAIKGRLPQTLVMEELEKPRQAFIFKRGLYKSHGERVNPATPAVLPPMVKGAPRNRLGLAQWLVSGQHPLTARVLVNRIWQQYFGVGIVRTAEDFGTRGEIPTHPELLDYLATELVDGKWDLKKLHKRIVLSATYRQASTTSKVKLDRDPENRLLARGPRLRLSAEMVRDNAIAVSGLLVEKIGGESVKPVQPSNAWKTIEGFMSNAYQRDRDEKQYRRALYVYWKRGSPYPSMLNFDAVKRDSCTVTRAITTTPVQALTLLNDPVYIECAKMLGQRMKKDREAIRRARDLKQPEEDAKRLAYGFRLCTSRFPTEQELQILRKLLDDQRSQFKADANAAKKLLSVGDAKIDETLDAAEAAAWACVGSALINLDATIHR